MTTINLIFRPGVTTSVEIPDANLLFQAVHQKLGAVPNQAEVIQQAWRTPSGPGAGGPAPAR